MQLIFRLLLVFIISLPVLTAANETNDTPAKTERKIKRAKAAEADAAAATSTTAATNTAKKTAAATGEPIKKIPALPVTNKDAGLYDVAQFVKYNWRFPDSKYYSIEREEYSLDEVKGMLTSDLLNPVLIRIVEKPVMQYAYTPLPESSAEAIDFGVGKFSNNGSAGTNSGGMSDRRSLVDWTDMWLTIDPSISSYDKQNGVKRLFDYLTDYGVCRKDKAKGGGAASTYQFSHYYFTANYSSIKDAILKMNNLAPTFKDRLLASFEAQYQISKKIMDFRVGMLRGLMSLRDIERLPVGAQDNLDPILVEWLDAQPMISTDVIFDELKSRNKILMKQLINEKIGELLSAEDSSDMQTKLSELSLREAIAFSQYFARSRMQFLTGTVSQDAIRMMRSTNYNMRIQSGDAKVYTSLTSYVIDQVIRPVNKNLEGWRFGSIDDQRTRHRYMVGIKAYSDNGQTQFAVTYFDPVLLASMPLMKYTNQATTYAFSFAAKNKVNYDMIIDDTDVIYNRNQNLYLQRYAEDIIKQNINPDLMFTNQ
ncbi:MAG: hypothetical protein HZC28_19980 [Spirochaetes bacterium]|nr:hypothetical protein [Spirochaetota bacterium]